MCGDFNADFKTPHGKLFLDFVESNNFTYHIDEPTRITEKTATVLVLTKTKVNKIKIERPRRDWPSR